MLANEVSANAGTPTTVSRKRAVPIGDEQITLAVRHLESQSRNPLRDIVMFRLSVNQGLAADEIGSLKWRMALDASGRVADDIHVEGRSRRRHAQGRRIPTHPAVRKALEQLYRATSDHARGPDNFVLRFRKHSTDRRIRSHTVQEFFRALYRTLGFEGMSSHSGRRAWIDKVLRKTFVKAGASIEDARVLAGHADVATTLTYIEPNRAVHRALVIGEPETESGRSVGSEMTLGQVLKREREALKLNQAKMAELVDLDSSTVSLYERNIMKPSLAALGRYADRLKEHGRSITYDELLELRRKR